MISNQRDVHGVDMSCRVQLDAKVDEGYFHSPIVLIGIFFKLHNKQIHG